MSFLLALVTMSSCWHLSLTALQAPSGSPPDVSSQLLDICDVVDACEGLSIDAVIEAAERQLKPSGSAGEHQLSRLALETETVSADVGSCGCIMSGFGVLGEGGGAGGRPSERLVKRAGTC